MGLAAYGTDAFCHAFEEMVGIDAWGFHLNQKYFNRFGTNQGLAIHDDGTMSVDRHYSEHMIERFGAPRKPGEECTQRDMDLAFGLQKRFEHVYVHQARLLHNKVAVQQVAIAGGCALNSVANGKLLEQTPFTESCIQPAAGDDGLAMGAALYVSNSKLKEGRRWAMVNAYLGDDFSDAAVKAAMARRGLEYVEYNRGSLIETTVDHIVEGQVVGWFQGRMEWGPRALGNRSILVHPGFPGIKDILNARIKRREWFRPFAPVVLCERQAEICRPIPSLTFHVARIRSQA